MNRERIVEKQYSIIAQTDEDTVVAEYRPLKGYSSDYQTEAGLEKEFIRMLVEQGYEHLGISCEADLVANLRARLSELNGCEFTDSEWDRFFSGCIAKESDGIEEKARRIQEDCVQVLVRDDGSSRNIRLIDRKNVHSNALQVVNQYVAGDGAHKNRYDVTILVNGLPLVHIELKRRGVPLREAFNQIDRYQRESFWSGCGLFEYVQIFVISNGTHTKYYSNTTRRNAVKTALRKKTSPEKTSHSFEFTSYWADSSNRPIADLVDFTRTFFARHTLLNVLTRYCVFTSERMLLVMRPYQIAATEKILSRIEIASQYRKYGRLEGGGYVWHTTGSGKTLTSFKTARLASQLDYIDKVLFVVDRKDLDYQTMKEYDRFEKGAANGNSSTRILQRQLENPQCRIIITTIQKLSVFIRQHPRHDVYGRHVVIIFDECHRSQFGDMHAAIVRHFRKYHIFGFTGTPIFAQNASAVHDARHRTTAQTFGDRLHAYTIIDAINDRNVLPFHVEYVKTVDFAPDIEDKPVWDIDREKVFAAPERIEKVVKYILDSFDEKTYRSKYQYRFSALADVADVASAKSGHAPETKKSVWVSGFNSIFAVAGIPMAKRYYAEFRRQMAAADPSKRLRVALIYSYGPNPDDPDGFTDEENPEDTSQLSKSDREFLEAAIADYNAMFSTNYSTDGDSFQNYYRDVSLRMKNREIDLLIVVNMFLTGFDATTLNTLWVDRNLRMHGLLQAFSRTNRILNSVKRFGNVVCFRNLQKAVDDAIALFGDKDAAGIILLRPFGDYFDGYDDNRGVHHDGYAEMLAKLLERFPLSSPVIAGEQNQKDFIRLFGAVLRMRNLLASFDEFAARDTLSAFALQNYLGIYQDLRDEWIRHTPKDKENITDDVVFEIELIRQIDINIDYILMLVRKYHEGQCRDKDVLGGIRQAMNSSPELRSKKRLIETFISRLNEIDDVDAGWRTFVSDEKERRLGQIIREENLRPAETRKFVEDSFRAGAVKATGTELNAILPPMSRFGGSKSAKKQTVFEKLSAFLEEFFGAV